MFNFKLGSIRTFGLATGSGINVSRAGQWSRILFFLLVGTAGTAHGASAATPFFYDQLPPQLRLENNLLLTDGLSIFEQSRRVATPLTFPLQPYARPAAPDQPPGAEQSEETPLDSEMRVFDSVTILFDATEAAGLHQVLANTVAHLTQRGADIIDSCHGAACGDGQRWNERFSLYGTGSTEQQAYYRLEVSAPTNGAERIVSDIFEVYATRLGCCVRLAVSHHKPNVHQYQVRNDGALDPATFPLKTFSIYFDSGHDELDRTQRDILTAKAAAMGECHSGRLILLEGHADTAGHRASNQALSERRLAAVRTHLLTIGIADDCLVTAAYGDTSPASPSAAEQRRVVVRMLPADWKIGTVATRSRSAQLSVESD